MDSLLNAFLLSIVQGLTEFLPVSSTGHQIITAHLLGLDDPRIDAFNVVIQFGSILAVVIIYRDRLWGLLKPRPTQRFSGLRGIFLLMLTSFPAALLGLLAHSTIKVHLFTPATVAMALGTGAVCMLLVEYSARKRSPRIRSLDDMTPAVALGIGLCQCCALWPGFSRSGSTIMGGMLFGAERGIAAEYSFIAAVPIMVAATGYELWKSLPLLAATDLPFFAVGMIGAFLSGWLAIKTFIALVSRVSLLPFAVYRLALAPLVYYFMAC